MSNIIEDLAELSDSDSNDEDYCPSAGEESDDALISDTEELDDNNVEDENDAKSSRKKHKKKRQRNVPDKIEDEEIIEEKQEFSKEEEKKHADSLWADFLQDVGPVPKKAPLKGSPGLPATVSKDNSSSNIKKTINAPPSNSVSVTEEYEFAGEKVVVTKEIAGNSKEAVKKEEKTENTRTIDSDPKVPSQLKVSGGVKRTSGLDSILGKIGGKKQKINTLEKSLLDWKRFKNDEGIEEELQTHNRGKDGYLERQAFLERTDLRQFEIERNLRMTNRSNR